MGHVLCYNLFIVVLRSTTVVSHNQGEVMPKNDVRSPVTSQESAEEEFPSRKLVEAVMMARGNVKRFVLPGDIKAVQTELRYIALNVTYNIVLRANQPLPLSDGKLPTILFATSLIQALHLKRSDGEDDVLNLFTQELKQTIADRKEPLSLKNGNELACDSRGELVLRVVMTPIQAAA